MAHTFLKIAFYGFAWVSPALILVMVSRWMRARSMTAARQRLVVGVLVPLVWSVGLAASLAGQFLHQSAWLAEHPGGALTEEEMMTVGDYPNVFAGWVLVGWVPVGVGLILARRWQDRVR